MKCTIRKTSLALAVASILSLSACVDNEKSANSTPIAKSTSGVITGFGSVFINGVEYETDNTEFVIDGVVGDESLLKLGMVVSLSGTAASDGTGNALSIEFDDDVEGVVISTSIDAEGVGSLNILGVTVNIDEDTVFESKDSSILSVVDVVEGNIIEVSGHSSGDGNVWATRIEVKSAVKEDGTEMEVKGTLTSLDEDLKTFVIGSITVDYSSAELAMDFVPADGFFVEVKSIDGINADGILVANKIELEDEGKKSIDYDKEDDEVELEGVITLIVSDTEIEVNGHPVLLSASTQYGHGSAAVIALGLKVKVKGNVDASEKLVAEKIIFKPSGDIKLAGRISATDIAQNTITVFGANISLNNSTLVKDDRDNDSLGTDEENIKYKFGVDDLAVDDWVELKAYIRNGELIASKLERETAEVTTEGSLRGKLVLDDTSSVFSIAGITLDLTALTDASPADGTMIELQGMFDNGVFTASKGNIKASEGTYISGEGKDEDDLEKEHDENESEKNEDHDASDDSDDENDDGESDDDSHLEDGNDDKDHKS